MNTTDKPRPRPRTSKLHDEPHPLEALFAPKTVAVIGATERMGTVGRTILWNLVSSPFGGTVFPVNRKRSTVLGIPAYPSIGEVPMPVDLALIVTPAQGIPAIVGECVDAGVQCAVITSGGFREAGAEGVALERRLVDEARRGGLRLVGPNCLGIMNPVTGLNATYAAALARPGNVAFISQSGALCTAVLDWSLRTNVGFSHFVSIGGMVDIGWGDLVDYLGRDSHTKSILLYMESIGNDAAAFLSAAREVALAKPVIVIKSGRTPAAERAVASHTGVVAGTDEVLDAAFRRVGVLRVSSIAELFYMAEVLGRQPRPRGPRLTIVTNAGGPGVIATDALHQSGGELARIGERALKRYNEVLPPEWSHNNPVDLGGDASPARYSAAVEVALADEDSDGLLVVLTPQAMTDPTATADELCGHVTGTDKPVLASWMGGADVAAGETILNRANIPTFAFPDTAARVFGTMWQHSYNLRALYETPALPASHERLHREPVDALLGRARAAGREMLTAAESKWVLAEYGIPVIGEDTVLPGDGFELMLGATVDRQFGPVLMFGTGGRLREVYEDRALALPPLNTTLARRMMERTRIYRALQRIERGQGGDGGALEELLVRFSTLVAEQPSIKEIEVNPLLVSGDFQAAVDARIVLHEAAVGDDALPRLAIRPYPAEYVSSTRLRDGLEVTVRPIRPEDEPAMVQFHAGLSERTVYFRYFQVLNLDQRISHERLTRICFIDYSREIALIAEHEGPNTGTRRIVAVGRITKIPATRDAEFAIVVSDEFQGQGLGSALLRNLIDVARREGVSRVVADMLPDNHEMQHICERHGFAVCYVEQTQMLHAELTL